MRSVKQRLLILFCLCLLSVFSSCFTLVHTVGGGPTGSEVVTQRQWYWMFGAGRIGQNVDSEQLAGNATSYRVTSYWSLSDMFLNLFTLPFTVASRTVTLEK